MSANTEAIEATLATLTDLGRLEPIDAAHVQGLRSMAAALDRDPGNAALWRQYREALADLLEADSDADSDLAEALETIRSAAPMGDASPS